MKTLFIVLIAIASLIVFFLLVWTIIMYFVYRNNFHRTKNLSLLDLDLSKTHYAPYIDILKRNINEFKALPCEIVEITNDNLKLKARYYNRNSENTVIFIHGFQAQSFNNFHASSRSFFAHNYNVLLIDQRAHNDSEGKYTTVGLKEQYDVLKWIKYLEDNTNVKNIVLYGVSMGAATIGYLSNKLQDTKVRSLIMDCGFISFYDEVFFKMRRTKFNFLVAPFMRMWAKLCLHIDIKENTLDSLCDCNLPVYIIHGTNDNLVPVEHSIAAYNSLKSDKRIHYVNGAGHTAGFMVDYDYLDQDVFEFINKYIK